MPITLVFIGLFIYGVITLKNSKNYKLKAVLVSLFFAPISCILMFSLYSWLFFDLSPSDLQRIGCGLNANHYSECYPEGYFLK